MDTVDVENRYGNAMNRRVFLATSVGAILSVSLWGEQVSRLQLTPEQSKLFRAWMVRIISAQFKAGPNPRWEQRDCVGLVRFAVAESLQVHDPKWKKANNLGWAPLPPELTLSKKQSAWRHQWKRSDGTKGAYVSAIDLVQENARYLGKDNNVVKQGDLLFYDQGDAQHIMVWMGNFIAYHTGEATPSDNGLRSIVLPELMRWPDTRWHPSTQNPNFIGYYRFNFLTV